MGISENYEVPTQQIQRDECLNATSRPKYLSRELKRVDDINFGREMSEMSKNNPPIVSGTAVYVSIPMFS